LEYHFVTIALLAIAVAMKVIDQEAFKPSKSILFKYLNVQANDVRMTIPLGCAFHPIVCMSWLLGD
jgi:hypothetical protein